MDRHWQTWRNHPRAGLRMASPYSPHADVAASADSILSREPESTRIRMAAILGWMGKWPHGFCLRGCHDLGKACPGFQCKWPELLAQTGLRLPRSPNSDINHAFVSQIALAELLQETGGRRIGGAGSRCGGCHHGNRASPTTLDHLRGDRRALGCDEWAKSAPQPS